MRYVIGYTDTPTGRDALALGIRLARSYGGSLHLVIVLGSESKPTLTPTDPGYERFLQDTAAGWLAEAEASLPDDIEHDSHIVYADSFSEGLLGASRDLLASMIVIGAARGGLLGRFALGTVASDLLHSAKVPVALAPEGARRVGNAPLSRITCAIGTRAGADALLDGALLFARRGDSPLRLLSLVAIDQPGGSADRAAVERAREHATAVVEQARTHLPDDLVPEAVIATGDRIEDAVQSIDWDPAEIVFVGSSRLARPQHLFLGSTAAKILRELPVPMVVVPRDSVLTLGE